MRFPFLYFSLAIGAALGGGTAASFEPNLGQTDQQVLYLARTSTGKIFFTADGISFPGADLHLEGADKKAIWEATGLNPNTTSYILGRDHRRWIQGVPSYQRLLRRGIYPGIDLAFHGQEGRVEYDFILAPRADPSQIRLSVSRERSIQIDAEGALVIETEEGLLRHTRPVIYQTLADGSRRRIAGKFVLSGKNSVGFRIGRRDPSLPLTIDPALDYSSYVGGSGDDSVIAADAYGNMVGNTSSVDFPGAVVGRRNGGDIFITLAGAAPVTYVIGGTGNDVATTALLSTYSSSGTISVGGYTNSTDFPTVIQYNFNAVNQTVPWQTDYAGGASDGFFIQVINNGGAPTFYSSYLGGPGDDKVTGLANGFIVGTTTARGLPGISFGNAPVIVGPGGGIDGFALEIEVSQYFAYIEGQVYFGGSGDDIPYAIAASNAIYIAGETTSADFPSANAPLPQLNGASDAFLLQFNSLFAGPTQATLFGGSGRDRAVAINAFGGTSNVFVAGVTASPDFPVKNASQSAFGGGASDAFLTQFSPDLSQIVSSTYFGGSGADEATSIAADSFGNLFLAGWTASPDFPVQNGQQAKFGGGPDDGFFVQFDAGLTLVQSSFFGGSGSDRILGLTALGGPSVLLAGTTTSTDLPIQNAAQATLHGPSDGFVAKISTDTFSIFPLVGAKGLRTGASFAMGDTAATASATVTVTSSDSSQVLLALAQTDAGQPSVSFPGSASGSFQIDCLTDQGGADVTISSPGYSSRTLHANCYPVQLGLQYPLNSNPVQTYALTRQTPISLFLKAGDPANPSFYNTGNLQPGAAPITVQLSNSNNAVGSLLDSSVQFTAPPPSGNIVSVGTYFSPLTVGQTTVSFQSASLLIPASNQVVFNVGSPLSPINPYFAVPVGFQVPLNLSQFPPVSSSQQVTVSSGDPSNLLVSTSVTALGSATAVAGFSLNQVLLQAVGSVADVPVTLSMAGFDPVTIIVHVTPPVASLSSPNPYVPFGLKTGGTANVIWQIFPTAPPNSSITSAYFLPSSTLSFSFDNSNPAAVTGLPLSVIPGPGASSISVAMTGAAPGSSTVNLHPPAGITAPAVPLTVNVTAATLGMDNVEVGYNLVATMNVKVPYNGQFTPVITTSDPTLVLVSTNAQSPGAAAVTATINVTNRMLTFYVYGLAASGTGTITVTIPTLAPVTATVSLDPSGLAWTKSVVSVPVYSSSSVQIAAYALDPAGLFPVALQTFRPGVSPTFTLSNNNSSVVSTPSNPVSSGFITVSASALGDAYLTILQPSGYTAPSANEQLLVHAIPANFTLQYGQVVIGKDTEAQLPLSANGNPAQPLTVTSSDPSRLLLSTDQNTPGSASVTIPNIRSGYQIWAQALDSQGSVQVTAAAPTFNSLTFGVQLAPVGISLQAGNSSVPISSGKVQTTLLSPSSILSLIPYTFTSGSLASAGYLRPGFPGWQVSVTSSNPSVGKIQGSPVTVVTQQFTASNVVFMPLSVGETVVSVVLAPGMTSLGSSPVTFEVNAPTFTANNAGLGKDLMEPWSASLAATIAAQSNSVAVTVTSGDPTRVVISATGTSTPSGSININMTPGNTSVNFYLQGLANSGVVPVTIHAPGFADSTFNVSLSDAEFDMGNGGIGPFSLALQAGTQSLNVSMRPAVVPTGYSNAGFAVRTGAADIPLTIAASDPTVLAVDTPQVVMKAGVFNGTAQFHPVGTGSATLTLSAPAGYVTDPVRSQASYTVTGAPLSVNFPLSTLGQDLQEPFSINSFQGSLNNVPVTVTSSDPSLLLLSMDPATPGQASVTYTGQQGSQNIYAQALAGQGTVTVSASAPNYRSASTTVSLLPSAAVFTATQTTLTAESSQSFIVSLTTLNAVTLQPNTGFSGYLTARPGAFPPLAVTSSDPATVSVTPSQVVFTPGAAQAPAVSVRGQKAGTASISLAQLPHEPQPSSGGQLTVTVNQGDLVLPDFTLARSFVVPVQVQLASRLPVPTQPVTLSIQTPDTFLIGFSSSPLSTGVVGFTSVTIAAGQRVSTVFYVQGLSTSGTASIMIGGGGIYQSITAQVTLVEPAFIFAPATLSMSPNSTVAVTVTPGIPSATLASTANVPISIGTSNSSIATVTPTQTVFPPGALSATFTITSHAPGSAILSLSGSNYDFSSTLAVTVR